MKNKITFNSWFTGILEGSGMIVTPENQTKPKGRKNYPHIQIAFNSKDTELAKKIISVIGCGFLTFDKSGNTVRIYWTEKEGIMKVIERINGHMRTSKIIRLHKLVDWFYVEEDIVVEKKSVDSTSISENSWLSGFSDADSNFIIKISNKNNGYRVQREWRIEYEETNQKEWIIEVSAYLESNLLSNHWFQSNKLYSNYQILAHNPKSLKKLEEYFEKYPLYSSKYLDYKDWQSCGQMTEKNPETYKKLIEIKSGMNSSRTNFSWNHLN